MTEHGTAFPPGAAIPTTEMRGEKWPWVLRDEQGLLEPERCWRLLVESDG